jgi:hypothetical protein
MLSPMPPPGFQLTTISANVHSPECSEVHGRIVDHGGLFIECEPGLDGADVEG